MLRKVITVIVGVMLSGCQSVPKYEKTAKGLVVQDMMGTWFVIASRPTFLETDAFNATETYTLNKESGEIDVKFSFNQGGFTGKQKVLRQKARLRSESAPGHWLVSMDWVPFDFDYLILDREPAEQWVAIGVPSQDYLWIMARRPLMSKAQLDSILKRISKLGYVTKNTKLVPQQTRENN